MNRREAAQEPSMEEILASIRKIIADEPAAAATELPLPQLSPVGFPGPARESQPAPSAPKPSLTSRLNDAFGPGSNSSSERADQPAKPAPAPRMFPVRSVMDDDLGDMLADSPPPATVPQAKPPQAAPPRHDQVAAEPSGPTVIASAPPARRPFQLDAGSAELLSGRTPIPAPGAPSRLTELRTTPAPSAQPEPKADVSLFKPQNEAARPAPVVIASMAPMQSRPLPPARPFNYVPEAPGNTSPAAEAAPAQPDPVVIASASPVAPMREAREALPQQAPSPPAPAASAPAKAEERFIPPGISPSTFDFLKPAAEPAAPFVAPPPAIAAVEAPLVTPAPQPAMVETALLDSTVTGSMAAPVPQPAPVMLAVEPAPITAVTASMLAPAPIMDSIPTAPSPVAAAPVTDLAAAVPAASIPETNLVTPPGGTSGLATADPSAALAADEIDPSVAVASALGALAAGLAASSREAVPEIVVSAVEISPPKSEAAQSPDHGTTEAPVAALTGVSVFASPDSIAGSQELKPISTSTLDDTAAELLRPMLRQWLDDNMPRIVERALRIELAEVDVTPKPDPKP